jgi:putative thioredoxin
MTSVHVKPTNAQEFETDVIAASADQPVLVDFWAPWCAPCRSLMPVLERVVDSFGGALKLVKVNTEEEQMLAQMFGIRSLPTVVLFKDGKPVDGFMGNQPEALIRQFLGKHLSAAVEEEMDDQLADPIDQDIDARIQGLQEKIAAEPSKEEPKVELADLYAQLGDIDEAERLLGSLAALAEGDGAKRVKARIQFAQIAQGAASAVDLQDLIAKDSKNLRARRDLAARFIAAKQYAAGMDQLLMILRTDRGFESDAGRKLLLDAFHVCEDQDLVSDYRRKLSAALF